jgi:ribosomal protein S18 acetylase RimI-like enzyme
MSMQIRLMTADDVDAVLDLSIRAWEPVFRSFEQVLGTSIYLKIYPDWEPTQREVVRTLCEDEKSTTWVADVDGTVAGFVVYKLDTQENGQPNIGEVELLAVDPRFQNRGIGTALNTFALDKLREAGMTLAVVGTGGDPGHAAARRSYEKAGYTALPIVRYYKDL